MIVSPTTAALLDGVPSSDLGGHRCGTSTANPSLSARTGSTSTRALPWDRRAAEPRRRVSRPRARALRGRVPRARARSAGAHHPRAGRYGKTRFAIELVTPAWQRTQAEARSSFHSRRPRPSDRPRARRDARGRGRRSRLGIAARVADKRTHVCWTTSSSCCRARDRPRGRRRCRAGAPADRHEPRGAAHRRRDTARSPAPRRSRRRSSSSRRPSPKRGKRRDRRTAAVRPALPAARPAAPCSRARRCPHEAALARAAPRTALGSDSTSPRELRDADRATRDPARHDRLVVRPPPPGERASSRICRCSPPAPRSRAAKRLRRGPRPRSRLPPRQEPPAAWQVPRRYRYWMLETIRDWPLRSSTARPTRRTCFAGGRAQRMLVVARSAHLTEDDDEGG